MKTEATTRMCAKRKSHGKLCRSHVRSHLVIGNTAAKRTAHEYKFKLPVNYAFPVTY